MCPPFKEESSKQKKTIQVWGSDRGHWVLWDPRQGVARTALRELGQLPGGRGAWEVSPKAREGVTKAKCWSVDVEYAGWQ